MTKAERAVYRKRPHVREQEAAYTREYRKRPEIKEKRREEGRKEYAIHREEVIARNQKYKSLNPEKIQAQNILNRAIALGEVLRPDTCPCGNPNPDGHHADYSKPLMVSWLCRACHKKLHAGLKLFGVWK